MGIWLIQCALIEFVKAIKKNGKVFDCQARGFLPTRIKALKAAKLFEARERCAISDVIKNNQSDFN